MFFFMQPSKTTFSDYFRLLQQSVQTMIINDPFPRSIALHLLHHGQLTMECFVGEQLVLEDSNLSFICRKQIVLKSPCTVVQLKGVYILYFFISSSENNFSFLFYELIYLLFVISGHHFFNICTSYMIFQFKVFKPFLIVVLTKTCLVYLKIESVKVALI